MKKREQGFLSEENIRHDSEVFDYIRELHDYLWGFVRCHIPRASGKLRDYIDDALAIAEGKKSVTGRSAEIIIEDDAERTCMFSSMRTNCEFKADCNG